MFGLVQGLALTVLGAICAGGFGLLLRLQRRYAWENTWMLSQFVTMIFLPIITLQLLLSSSWISAIEGVADSTVFLAMGLGFFWGIGGVAFAIGIESVGLSLGYATIMGVITSVGSIIPMVRKWGAVPHDAKLITLCGIVVCLMGVVLYGRAGILREKGEVASSISGPTELTTAKNRVRMTAIGLGWCLLSGILSSCSNIGFDFAAPIARALEKLGARPLQASLVRWVPVFWGGYLAVIVFSGIAMTKNHTWRNFTKVGTGLDFTRAVSLGALSFFAQGLYGMGASSLGLLGTTVGYAVFLSLSIVVALVFGFLIGEWKQAPRRSLNVLQLGVTVLIAAVVILAYGNSLVSR
ncbi:MAG: L-rhamnose/proton symporter RhaT [Candidatus Sulfotelmatobacter sp.]